METKDDGRVDDGKLIESVNETLVVELFGQGVVEFLALGVEELSVLIEEEVSHVLIEVSDKDSAIIVVRDSATIHSLTNQILE